MSEEHYYCLKCKKFHSIDYNTHKKYMVDFETLADMNELIREQGDKIEDLRDRLSQIEKALDKWNMFMLRKDRTYRKHWREL